MNGYLYLEAGYKQERSFLKNLFVKPPYKIADVTERQTNAYLRLMIMSSSPGVLDNDHHKIIVKVDSAASVSLETQAYHRLFPMKAGASQMIEVELADQACLVYLPHPCVPHRQTKYAATNRICITAGGTLVWGEIITSGRGLKNESFTFSSYHSITEVYCRGKLIIRENLLIEPHRADWNTIGRMEGFTHYGSLILICDRIRRSELKQQLDKSLNELQGVIWGFSETKDGHCVVRVLGHKVEPMYNCFKEVGYFVLAETDQRTQGSHLEQS